MSKSKCFVILLCVIFTSSLAFGYSELMEGAVHYIRVLPANTMEPVVVILGKPFSVIDGKELAWVAGQGRKMRVVENGVRLTGQMLRQFLRGEYVMANLCDFMKLNPEHFGRSIFQGLKPLLEEAGNGGRPGVWVSAAAIRKASASILGAVASAQGRWLASLTHSPLAQTVARAGLGILQGFGRMAGRALGYTADVLRFLTGPFVASVSEVLLNPPSLGNDDTPQVQNERLFGASLAVIAYMMAREEHARLVCRGRRFAIPGVERELAEIRTRYEKIAEAVERPLRNYPFRESAPALQAFWNEVQGIDYLEHCNPATGELDREDEVRPSPAPQNLDADGACHVLYVCPGNSAGGTIRYQQVMVSLPRAQCQPGAAVTSSLSGQCGGVNPLHIVSAVWAGRAAQGPDLRCSVECSGPGHRSSLLDFVAPCPREIDRAMNVARLMWIEAAASHRCTMWREDGVADILDLSRCEGIQAGSPHAAAAGAAPTH